MLHKMLSPLFKCLSIVSPLPSVPVLSLYFHNPSAEAFEKFIKWGLKNSYEFIDLQLFIDFIEGKVQLHKSIFISLDDGWRGNLSLIPVLEKYNVPITIFVPVEPLLSGNYWWEYVYARSRSYTTVEEYKKLNELEFNRRLEALKKKFTLERTSMTVDEVKKISSHPLVTIQSHSYSHPILTNLSECSLDYELSASKEYLSQLLGSEINVFSYPNGSLSNREIEAVGKYYNYAFTTKPDYPKVNCNRFQIPRIALTDDYWRNICKIKGIFYKIKDFLQK